MSDANQIGKANAEAWETAAIEACKNDPDFPQHLCPTCVVNTPCLCDKERSVGAMRRYYDDNYRDQPTRSGSWGAKIDVFMEELYRLATARHDQIVKFQRGKPEQEP